MSLRWFRRSSSHRCGAGRRVAAPRATGLKGFHDLLGREMEELAQKMAIAIEPSDFPGRVDAVRRRIERRILTHLGRR